MDITSRGKFQGLGPLRAVAKSALPLFSYLNDHFPFPAHISRRLSLLRETCAKTTSGRENGAFSSRRLYDVQRCGKLVCIGQFYVTPPFRLSWDLVRTVSCLLIASIFCRMEKIISSRNISLRLCPRLIIRMTYASRKHYLPVDSIMRHVPAMLSMTDLHTLADKGIPSYTGGSWKRRRGEKGGGGRDT